MTKPVSTGILHQHPASVQPFQLASIAKWRSHDLDQGRSATQQLQHREEKRVPSLKSTEGPSRVRNIWLSLSDKTRVWGGVWRGDEVSLAELQCDTLVHIRTSSSRSLFSNLQSVSSWNHQQPRRTYDMGLKLLTSSYSSPNLPSITFRSSAMTAKRIVVSHVAKQLNPVQLTYPRHS